MTTYERGSVSPEVHERHHQRVAQAVAAAKVAKDKRRAGGYAASILRGHLGSAHGVRTLSGPPKTLAQLHALHVRFHQEAQS